MAKPGRIRSLPTRVAQSIRRLPLSIQLGVPLAAVSVLTAVALGLTMGTSASAQVEKDFTDHAQRLGGYLAASIASDLTDQAGNSEPDQVAAQRFVAGLVTSDKTMRSIRVFQRVH